MPLRLLRLFALAIAIVLPLQGMAAVVAGQCMAMGHHQDAAGDDGHAGQDEHDHAAHAHSGDGDGPSITADADGKVDGHCGPCTACCASASIAGPTGLSLVPLPSNAKYGYSQQPPPGVQPDGLDRPPLAL